MHTGFVIGVYCSCIIGIRRIHIYIYGYTSSEESKSERLLVYDIILCVRCAVGDDVFTYEKLLSKLTVIIVWITGGVQSTNPAASLNWSVHGVRRAYYMGLGPVKRLYLSLTLPFSVRSLTHSLSLQCTYAQTRTERINLIRDPYIVCIYIYYIYIYTWQ